jgi:predicted RecB family endonuclease
MNNTVINLAAQLVNAVVEPAVQSRPAEEQALVLAATIELEHLLIDRGWHLSATPDAEIILCDDALRRLATMLLDVWQRTLPENVTTPTTTCQQTENSVSDSVIASLRSMLAEWRRHHIFIAALPTNR